MRVLGLEPAVAGPDLEPVPAPHPRRRQSRAWRGFGGGGGGGGIESFLAGPGRNRYDWNSWLGKCRWLGYGGAMIWGFAMP